MREPDAIHIDPLDESDRFDALRRKAKQLLGQQPDAVPKAPEGILELIHELEIHQAELRIQNEELQRAQEELSTTQREFQELYEFAPCAYLSLTPEGIISRINLAGVALLKQTRQILQVSTFLRWVADECQQAYLDALKRADRESVQQSLELRLKAGQATAVWVWTEIQAVRGPDGAPLGWRLTLTDISARKAAETALQESETQYRRLYQDMEKQVKARTTELRQANRHLLQEVESRRSAQGSLQERTVELASRSDRLEETNTALKVLLRELESERGDLEEKMVSNLNEMTRPHLAKLAAGPLSIRQRALVEAVFNSLSDITAPLSRRFIIEGSKLTPAQTHVANLIRQGKSTKEIAQIMGVAVSTVDYHRRHLRRRLNLTSKRINLQSYLKSLL